MKPNSRKKIRLYGSIFLAIGVTVWGLIETGPKFTFKQWQADVLAGGDGLKYFCSPQGNSPAVYTSFMFPRSIEVLKVEQQNLQEADIFFKIESMNIERRYISQDQKATVIQQDKNYCIKRIYHVFSPNNKILDA